MNRNNLTLNIDFTAVYNKLRNFCFLLVLISSFIFLKVYIRVVPIEEWIRLHVRDYT